MPNASKTFRKRKAILGTNGGYGTPSDSGDILFVDELSIYLKLPRSTTYWVLPKGENPYRRIGRHFRFRRSVIERWLKHDPRFGERVSEKTAR